MAKFCRHCGNQLSNAAAFCPGCGTAQSAAPATQPQAKGNRQAVTHTQPYVPPRQSQPYRPAPDMQASAPRPKKRKTSLIVAITAIVSLGLCAGVFFLFFADGEEGKGPGDKPMSSLLGEQAPDETASSEAVVTPSPQELLQRDVAAAMQTLQTQSRWGGLNTGAAFGLPQDALAYPKCALEVSVVLPQDDGGATLHYGQTSLMKGTDGIHELSLEIDGDRIRSGAYFTGDTMILQLADASLPMLQYTLPEGDGAVLASLTPMERYQLCLMKDDPAAFSGAHWAEHMNGITSALAASEAPIEAGEQAFEAGTTAINAATHSTTLSGEAAAAMLHGFVQTWQSDARTSGMLSLADNMILGGDSKEEGDAGDAVRTPVMEQLSDLPYAGDAYCTDATLVLKAASSEDGVVTALLLDYTSAIGDMSFALLFHARDDGEYLRIELTSPDGYYGETVEQSRKTGANAYTQDTSQRIVSPDDRRHIQNTFHTEMTENGDERTGTFSLSYMDDGEEAHAAESDIIAALESSGTYRHVQSHDAIDGELSGAISIEAEGERESYDFSGTIALDANEPPESLSIPPFIEASGITAQSKDELNSKISTGDLMDDFSNDAYRTTPLLQPLYTNMLLLLGEVQDD